MTPTPEPIKARFPLVEVRGSPRTCGRQYGEACREQVRRYAETLRRELAEATDKARAAGAASRPG